MEYNTDHFLSMLAKMNISLSDKQLQQFMTYYEMLIEKNKVMNLTAITDFDEVVEKHFVDSVSLIQVVDLHHPLKVIDLGTGAGFPGIPLKIVFPELNVVLADSLNKRLVFLNEVIDALGLTEIYTVHGPPEDRLHRLRQRDAPCARHLHPRGLCPGGCSSSLAGVSGCRQDRSGPQCGGLRRKDPGSDGRTAH